MPKAYEAREQLKAVMGMYYSAECHLTDPTTSTIVINRANVLTRYGYTGAEIGMTETSLPVVSTLNAVPTLFWMLLFVLARPQLLEKVRIEAAAAACIARVAGGSKTVTFNIADFDDKQPLLVRCYRETMRLANHSLSVRRIMEDTKITAGNGQTYRQSRTRDPACGR